MEDSAEGRDEKHEVTAAEKEDEEEAEERKEAEEVREGAEAEECNLGRFRGCDSSSPSSSPSSRCSP